MGTTPKAEDIVRRLRDSYIGDAAGRFDNLVASQNSPIEQVFVAQMVSGWSWVSAQSLPFRSRDAVDDMLSKAGIEIPSDIGDYVDLETFGMLGDDHAAAVAQGTIQLQDRRIRPDFAMVFRAPEQELQHTNTKLIVELDGHDFHERTPEQAQKDKSRDRGLQALGWRVLRFTGREVLRDPMGCVREATGLLFAEWRLARNAPGYGQ